MTAEALSSAAPPWAIRMWDDEHDIFVELPCMNSVPYVAKFPKTEAGLSKALDIMRVQREKTKPLGDGHYSLPEHPSLKKFRNFTDAQRSACQLVLRKMKLIASK